MDRHRSPARSFRLYMNKPGYRYLKLFVSITVVYSVIFCYYSLFGLQFPVFFILFEDKMNYLN